MKLNKHESTVNLGLSGIFWNPNDPKLPYHVQYTSVGLLGTKAKNERKRTGSVQNREDTRQVDDAINKVEFLDHL